MARLETEVVGGWLLRAGRGWTGRANAALPLRDTGDDLDAVLGRVARWYRARDLPPLVQLPLPVCLSLRDRLVELGWVDRRGAVVLTAGIDDVLGRTPRRPELPLVTIGDAPDPAWLGAYHYLGGSLPDVAVDVLPRSGVHATPPLPLPRPATGRSPGRGPGQRRMSRRSTYQNSNARLANSCIDAATWRSDG